MNNPLEPLPAEIERVAGMGFDFLELAMDAPQAHYRKVAKNLAAIRNALDDNGLKLVCHLPTFVYTADLTESIRNASREEVRRSIETAARLAPLKVVVHPSIVSGLAAIRPELVSAYAHDALSEVVIACEQAGLTPCLENMFPRYRAFVSAEQFDHVFQTFPHLKLTLDTGHANIGCEGENRATAFIALHAARLGHIHISDNRGLCDDHLTVGAGNIDFESIIAAIKYTGFDDTITLEIFSPRRKDLIESRQEIERLWAC
jgi:sugar phosphate isomerase/epimerase